MRMEEATEENNNDDDKGYFNSGGEEDFQSSSSSSIFPQLKQSCLQLLELHQNPNIASNASAPSQLLQLLRRCPPHSLQPFFEYVFPLPFFLPFFFFNFFPPCSVFSLSNCFICNDFTMLCTLLESSRKTTFFFFALMSKLDLLSVLLFCFMFNW